MSDSCQVEKCWTKRTIVGFLLILVWSTSELFCQKLLKQIFFFFFLGGVSHWHWHASYWFVNMTFQLFVSTRQMFCFVLFSYLCIVHWSRFKNMVRGCWRIWTDTDFDSQSNTCDLIKGMSHMSAIFNLSLQHLLLIL